MLRNISGSQLGRDALASLASATTLLARRAARPERLRRARLDSRLLLSRRFAAFTLRADALRIASLFAESPLGVCISSTDGAILASNPTLAAMTGLSDAELGQTNAAELCHLSDLFRGVARQAAITTEVSFPGRDGAITFARLNVSPVGGIEQGGLLWVFEDSAHIVQASEALRQAHTTLTLRHRIAEGLRTVMAALNSNQPLEHVLSMIAADARDMLGASCVAICSVDGESGGLVLRGGSGASETLNHLITGVLSPALLDEAVRVGRPMVVGGDHSLYEPGSNSADSANARQAVLFVPIVVDGAGFRGGILLQFTDRPTVSAVDGEFSMLFAGKAVLTIENAQLRASSQEIATTNERNRMARELHDSVTQSLYGIVLNSDATLLALAAGNTEKAELRLQQLKEIAREAMTETRLLIYHLRPSILEEQGLMAALRERLEAVEARSGLEVALQIEDDVVLPAATEAELLKMILEGLNNIIKHARAKHVQLQITARSGYCQVILTDDGSGFDVATSARYGGYGLKTIEERLQQIGGTVSITSQPGAGTQVKMEIPL